MPSGKLYLIPLPLLEGQTETIPAYVRDIIARLDTFIVEKAKTARHFVKSAGHSVPIAALTFLELDKHARPGQQFEHAMLEPLLAGKDVGLMSEAGCPGVADPGAAVVHQAHRAGIEVVPLVGPSAILLALMASGLEGQRFCFHGYLSANKQTLAADLRRLEQASAKARETQIFIETPYRNMALLQAALSVLSQKTLLCIAADLTGNSQFVQTKPVQQWRQAALPDLKKRPAVFLILA
jgi:16S rRNA (cytidine1402-2'-O)-methyltransferase